MERKKILHITSSLRRGGAEEVLCSLIEHMDAQRYEHAVLFFHGGPHEQRLRERGIEVHQINGFLFRYDPIFFIRLWRAIGTQKPDVIHCLLWIASVCSRFIARVRGIACVCVVHNNADQNGGLRRMLDRVVGASGAQVAAVSDEVAQSLAWIPAKKVAIVGNGIDVEAVHHRASQAQITREKLGLEENHWVFGSVGRFEPVKRYDLLIASFAIVYRAASHARLVLVGHGSQEQMLRELAKSLGVEQGVLFVVGQSAYGYYPLFDCFVLTSYKEGVSIALLEAMSFTLPCVITNSTIEHSVLQTDYSGLVVPTSDPAVLAAALVAVMNDRQMAAAWGKAAFSYVKTNGTVQTMVERYEKLFSMNEKKA